MKRTLDSLADRGCWISHDRVNAFISSAESGIAEVGYHGTQPVSKNARLFVGAGMAAVSMVLRSSDGSDQPISFSEVDWAPSRVAIKDRLCELEIAAFQRSIRCTVRPREEVEVRFTFDLRSLTRDVQGTRRWSNPEFLATSVVLSCRDRIVLNEWLKRTGPYAGDFLIPEPMRRIIFDKRVPSGEGSVEDLRPEFKDAAIPLYDASVCARMGGPDLRMEQREHLVTFVAKANEERGAEFYILFGDQRSDLDVPLPPLPETRTHRRTISVEVPGHYAVSHFVETVPGLVESAIVGDVGMPRATPAAYYWIWAWDSLVTGIEMLRWGDYATTRRMVEFVNAHRDDGGLIPGRWTRSLLPLDTPPRGSLEFLFLAFVYQHALETGELGPLIDAYPFLVHHLEELERNSDASGISPGSGFYPDFPARFGRSESSLVAMEVAAQYCFARMMDNIARLLSDTATERRAREMASRIERHFLDRFWDKEKGFLVDAVDMDTGEVNESYPLFTMLFAQSPLGLPLIRSQLERIAQFCSEELLGSFGTSLLPSWDRNRMNEDATASWYPHWDVYLLKILRRGGRATEIVKWLGNVERVLAHLGYCPEFIKLDESNSDDPSFWLNHGAVSNLNCVTGWFRAIVEGLFGIEVDPGGLSVVPLSLPIETLSLSGLVYRGSTWNITVQHRGEHLNAIVIDGTRWEGICKVPKRYHDGREHSLEVLYGDHQPDLQFREIINAKLIDVKESDASRTVTVRPLGTCDVQFVSRQRPKFFLNGNATDFEFDERTGIGTARFQRKGETELRLSRR
jgi:hypothetical protein